jgi:hypothetical protein
MSSSLEGVRADIQAQGFCGLINYPLRLLPAICMVWAAVGNGACFANHSLDLGAFCGIGRNSPWAPI